MSKEEGETIAENEENSGLTWERLCRQLRRKKVDWLTNRVINTADKIRGLNTFDHRDVKVEPHTNMIGPCSEYNITVNNIKFILDEKGIFRGSPTWSSYSPLTKSEAHLGTGMYPDEIEGHMVDHATWTAEVARTSEEDWDDFQDVLELCRPFNKESAVSIEFNDMLGFEAGGTTNFIIELNPSALREFKSTLKFKFEGNNSSYAYMKRVQKIFSESNGELTAEAIDALLEYDDQS